MKKNLTGNQKESLRNNRKPDLTHLRKVFGYYVARGCEYGVDKYRRADYLVPAATRAEEFMRLLQYIRATMDHLMSVADSMEEHIAVDPDLQDWEGMKAAAYAPRRRRAERC